MTKTSPWSAHIDRDDRALLCKIIDSKESSSALRSLLGPFLNSAIRSLHFSRSNRVGVDVPQDSLNFLSEQFLKWLFEKDEWTQLQESWSASPGPWSIPYFIHRAYYRFRRENFPQGIRGEVSYSGQVSFHELEGDGLLGLSQPFVDAFNFVTQSLPEELRLTYQLHLEGLLPPEIATLLRVDMKHVEERIALAKEFLEIDEPELGVGS